MLRHFVLEKRVGETPLDCIEAYRATQPELAGIPLAYAGRLDPMASGKLLVLVGDECKRQTEYHGLDKEYDFQILLGVRSDTGDVLGIVEASGGSAAVSEADCRTAANTLTGQITFPYPAYSSKTVQGKPLHTWSVEGRLDEIDIPTYTATIYKLTLDSTEIKAGQTIYDEALKKVNSLPPVTDPKKSLGNDFRRPDVRASWRAFLTSHATTEFSIAHFTCICASGVYMRTVAEAIADKLGTTGLAYSIHRTKIGRYKKIPLLNISWWTSRF